MQEVNLHELEEKYGADFRKAIERDIEHCDENKQDWKLKVVSESVYLIIFAFATHSYSQVYEISKKRKVIRDQYLIGSVEGSKIIALMNSFKA